MSFRQTTSIVAVTCLLICASSVRVAAAAEPPKTESNGLGMTLVLIPAGQFERGMTDVHVLTANHANTLRQGADHEDERPSHPVQITRPFWLARTR
jgi:formylglycine-generating enzyme required for sulfatase activity